MPATAIMGPDEPACGQAPHVPITVEADDLMGEGEERKLAAVGVTFGLCASKTFFTGPQGSITVWLTRGAATWIRFDHEEYVSWLIGEVTVADAFPTLTASMVPNALVDAVVPGFTEDRAVVLLQVQPGSSTAPEACRTPEGVKVTVLDQPAAKVLYRAAGASGSYEAARAVTSAEGVAVIRDLLPGATTAEIAASKPGCEYRAAYGDANSLLPIPIVRTPLFPGAITYLVLNPVW